MERISFKRVLCRAYDVFLPIVALLSMTFITGCGGDPRGGTEGGDGARRLLPSADEVAKSSDMLTIAVRYVSYRDSNGGVVADEQSVRDMLDYTSKIWAQCNIGLELVSYEVIEPSSIGEPYNPQSYSDIDRVRMKLQDDKHMLIIGSGTWGRSNGSLGSANCYSSFPGDEADGLICENKSASSPVIMAHEVGHWFYLKHTNNPSTDGVDDTASSNVGLNLMGNVIARSDDEMTQGQCERARRSVGEFRRNTVL